jgi:hypothetical protein
MEEDHVTLSEQVVSAIARKCTPEGIASMMKSCSYFEQICRDDHVWKPYADRLDVPPGPEPAFERTRRCVTRKICAKPLPSTVVQTPFSLNKNDTVVASSLLQSGEVAVLVKTMTVKTVTYSRVLFAPVAEERFSEVEECALYQGVSKHFCIHESRCGLHSDAASFIYKRKDYGPRNKCRLVEVDRTPVLNPYAAGMMFILVDGDYLVFEHDPRSNTPLVWEAVNWTTNERKKLDMPESTTSIWNVFHRGKFLIVYYVDRKGYTCFVTFRTSDFKRTQRLVCNTTDFPMFAISRIDPLVNESGRIHKFMIMTKGNHQSVLYFTNDKASDDESVLSYQRNCLIESVTMSSKTPIMYWTQQGYPVARFTRETVRLHYSGIDRLGFSGPAVFQGHLATTVPGMGIAVWNLRNGRIKFKYAEKSCDAIFALFFPFPTGRVLPFTRMIQAREDHMVVSVGPTTHILLEW